MTLKWIEGFEGFGVTPGLAPQPTGVLARKYTVNGEANMDIEEGWWSGSFSLELNNAGDYLHSPTFSLTGGGASQTTCTGFAVQFSNLGAYKFFSLYDDNSNESINLRLRADGEIDVYRVTTLLGTTSGAAIEADVWFFVELKIFTHNSAGTVDVRIDESSVLSLSGQDTVEGNYYNSSWRLWALSSGAVKFDHLHFLDGSGTKNNNLLGPKQVRTILPNAVGDSNEWTPTAGNNYECVDEDVIDDLTSYVASGVSGQQDLYEYPDISAAMLPEGIVGVQINNDCRRYGSVDFDLLAFAKGTGPAAVGGVASVDHDAFLTESSIMESDADGADWTRANFNSTQFGVKIG
jgi:hypothetical protein